ncbi:MAG: ATP synthase F1 subunit epsilon [Clostridiales bacterium]|nr:ATP synthase F1 subunit epsilon [Clostridiales bacterium]
MATFYLKIISSDRIFYKGPCHCLIIPALDGEKAVMAHHEEMIIAIQSGEMRMQIEENGEWTCAVLGQGFCQIANNRATLLADTVELPEEVDANRAREAYERAQERLRQKRSIEEYHLTQAAMARALVRLKETEKFVR